MSAFTPVYRRFPSKAPLWTQRKRSVRKRKLEDESEDDAGEVETVAQLSESEGDATKSRVPFPINARDPYYVAGYSRERPPLPGNYPHAALRTSGPTGPSLSHELASRNLPTQPGEAKSSESSARRRHLDNLTAIMHRCMLDGDWPRASKAWALILRIEIDGSGIDIRQHGRWNIGAELLMHPTATAESSDHQQGRDSGSVELSEAGLVLARQYYERLALQFPHNQRTRHKRIDSLVIYPALFNVWIFAAQNRAKRARAVLLHTPDDDVADMPSNDREQQIQLTYEDELEDAKPIAQRLDELMQSPPYDTTAPLLELRGGVALWLAELYERSSTARTNRTDNYSPEFSHLSDPVVSNDLNRESLDQLERQRAAELFSQMLAARMDLRSEYAPLAQ